MPLVDDKVIGQTPLPPLELPQGSYLLVFSAPGRAEIRYPFIVTRGEQLTLNVDLPQASRIPDGYVYIPPGRFLFGTAEADAIRQSFLQTTPLHMRETPGYLIAKYETTLGQWIEFLNEAVDEACIRSRLIEDEAIELDAKADDPFKNIQQI